MILCFPLTSNEVIVKEKVIVTQVTEGSTIEKWTRPDCLIAKEF